MATQKKSVVKKPQAQPTQIHVKANLCVPPDMPYYYVNSFEISGTSNEFNIIATRVPAKLSPEQREEVEKTGTLNLEANVHLIVPINVMPSLIEVLQNQRGMYEKQFGSIPKIVNN